MIIETAEELRNRIQNFREAEVLGLDCETGGFDPHQDELRLVQLSNLDDLSNIQTLVIDKRKVGAEATAEYLKPILENPEQIKCLHNAKFDAKFIKHNLGIDIETIFDSFLGSVILEAGVSKPKGWHSLEQVADRFAGVRLVKEEQRSDWTANELSESQIQYAKKDAEVLGAVRSKMRKSLNKLGLVRCGKLEFDCVMPVAYLELCGFYLDIDAWTKLADSKKILADKLAEEINQELQPVIPQQSLFGFEEINLDSHVQVKEYFSKLGIPMPESTKEYFLKPLAKKYPIIEKLLDYRGYIKAFGTFGEAFRAYINPATGRIHADFRQIGAETTGRFSVNNPNLQQIKSENEYRNCFKSQEGFSLVSLDYSQIELRLLADFARDKNAIQAFRDGIDFHTAMAAFMFKKSPEEVNQADRKYAKILNFAIPYGAGVRRVAEMCGVLEAEAHVIMQDYFKGIPQVEQWLKNQKRKVLSTKSSRTASGRLSRYEFDDFDGKARSMAQRNAVNSPIQGSSADILKRALRLFYDRGIKGNESVVKLVNIVHDEINIEVRDDRVDEFSAILHDSMVDAANEFVESVPIKVDTTIGKMWSKE